MPRKKTLYEEEHELNEELNEISSKESCGDKKSSELLNKKRLTRWEMDELFMEE